MSETDKGAGGNPPHEPILLSDRQRWASGMGGAVIGGGGAFATFITSNQAGATALMLVGGLGLLMSLTGRVPDKIGKEGIVHDPVEQASEKATTRAMGRAITDPELDDSAKLKLANLVSEEVATENLNRLTRTNVWVSNESPPVTGVAVRAVSEGLIYADRVGEALRRALPQGSRLRDDLVDTGTDFVVEPDVDHPESGRSIAIELKTVPPGPVDMQRLANLNAHYGAVLLVVPRGVVIPPRFVPDMARLLRVVEFGTFSDNGAFGTERRDLDELQAVVTGVWSALNANPEG
jgi:hypothetical protein